jgi:dolichol kinase
MSGSAERQHEAGLSEAVEKTKGIQPWRRVFHAANGTFAVLALTVLGLEVSTAVVILGVILAFGMVLDAVRLFDPKLNILFFRAFSFLASPREAKKIASSTWYALSAFLVLLFFPKPYALAGILVLAWADPAASVVGQRWGKTPFLAGTVRGTAAFVLVAFCALLFFVPWKVAMVTAVVTAIVEAAPVNLDDNLIVPLTVAGVLLLIGG